MNQETLTPGMTSGAQSSSNSLYSRSAEPVANGTMVPGVLPQEPSAPLSTTSPATPVVGFLYSISNGGVTEFWTLHLGTNTIGRAADCDIQLLEASISDHHATLSIKQMKSTGKVIASVRDTGSKNGMYLNDEELDYDLHSCQNGDVLTIGLAYKLLLVLVNPTEQGLTVADNFTPIKPVTPVPSYAQNVPVESKTISLEDANIDAGATRVM